MYKKKTQDSDWREYGKNNAYRHHFSRQRLIGIFVDVLLLGGWVLISVGVGLFSIPVSLIVAGALAIAGGIMLGRGALS